jgi:hypothetical protein
MVLWFLLGFLIQGAGQAQQPPSPPSQPEPEIRSLLNAKELRDLQQAAKLPARLQVLLAAGGRYVKAAEQALKADNSQDIQVALDAYGKILQACEWQMHSLGPGKPPNLKKQEITLRKYITGMVDLMAKADLDDVALFKTAIGASIQLRAHFLKTFFGTGSLKQP